MINGTDQLGIINQHIAGSRSHLDDLYQRKEAANWKLVQLHNRKSAEYRNLARFRLDELTANQMAARLDDTDRTVLKLLERRAKALQQLEPEIEQAEDRHSTVNTERNRILRNRDDLIRKIDDRAAELQVQLSQEESYQEQKSRADEEIAKADRAERKATQAEGDQLEKGKSYRDDQLFMYLWNRRFLTPDYVGSGVIRSLDGWVAGLINYGDARSNYYMLTELPVRLREHADRQKEIADKAVQVMRDMEARALNVDDIVQNKGELEKTQHALEQIEDRIEAEEAQHDDLLQQRTQFSSGSDEFFRQAIELQVSEIKNESLEDLYLQARKTPKPDDDVIVSRIRDLKQQETKIAEEIKALQVQESQHRQSYREMEELRLRYRRRGYDSRHSHFPSNFELGALLAMLMSGRATGGDVWDRIDREQQFRKPRTPRGFGGGMFSGGFGGGMGGGGFGTGGGFGGGGGGFRTGGGF